MGSSGGSGPSVSSSGASHSSQFTIPNPDIGTNIDDDIFADESEWVDVAGKRGRTPQTTKPAKGKRPPLNTWHYSEDEGKTGVGRFEPNHTKGKHIGKSDKELAERIEDERSWRSVFRSGISVRDLFGHPLVKIGKIAVKIGNYWYKFALKTDDYFVSSFKNDHEAHFFIRQTLERNQQLVEEVIDFKHQYKLVELDADFNQTTGRLAYAHKDGSIKFYDVSSVRIMIYRSGSERGFSVYTAFPRSRK